MSSPSTRPLNKKPTADPAGNKGMPPTFRVLSHDSAARVAAPSIAMPRARTELSELLADDDALCVRRRAPATAPRENAEAVSPSAPAVDGDLTYVIEAWPDLSRNIRAAVLALIRER